MLTAALTGMAGTHVTLISAPSVAAARHYSSGGPVGNLVGSLAHTGCAASVTKPVYVAAPILRCATDVLAHATPRFAALSQPGSVALPHSAHMPAPPHTAAVPVNTVALPLAPA